MDRLEDAKAIIAMCNLHMRRLTEENERLKMNKHTISIYGTTSKTVKKIETNIIPTKGDNLWLDDEHYVVNNRNIFYNENGVEIDIIVDLFEY